MMTSTKNGEHCQDGIDEVVPVTGETYSYECGCRYEDSGAINDEDCMYLNGIELDDNGHLERPWKSVGYNKPIPAYYGSQYVEIISYDYIHGVFIVNRLTKNFPCNPDDLRLANEH